jgi:hypothetical protein
MKGLEVEEPSFVSREALSMVILSEAKDLGGGGC